MRILLRNCIRYDLRANKRCTLLTSKMKTCKIKSQLEGDVHNLTASGTHELELSANRSHTSTADEASCCCKNHKGLETTSIVSKRCSQFTPVAFRYNSLNDALRPLTGLDIMVWKRQAPNASSRLL